MTVVDPASSSPPLPPLPPCCCGPAAALWEGWHAGRVRLML